MGKHNHYKFSPPLLKNWSSNYRTHFTTLWFNIMVKISTTMKEYDLLSPEHFRPDTFLQLGISTVQEIPREPSGREVSTINLRPPQYPYLIGMTNTGVLYRPNIRSSAVLRIAILFLSMVVSTYALKNDTTAAWNDIINNLGTDLAPLLALFGEQVTKQYLGESFSLVDNIIFALAPLGIITVVVSAIRISGSPALRSIIGRSTESRGVVEADLMSSTSPDVCELWNGEGIVRVLGSPLLLQLVFLRSHDPGMPKICTFREAVRDNFYRGDLMANAASDPESSLLALENPPNLSLNVDFKSVSPWKQAFCITLGVISQGAVLAFAGVIQFKLQYSGSKTWFAKQQQSPHAFWLFVGGTVVLAIGACGCAWVVETSTREISWKPDSTENIEVVWLQKGGQTVGDQLFEPFALRLKAPTISTSEKGKETALRRLVVWVAALGTIIGFIVQFIAFRMMNNLVTAAQLGAILLMVAARSWVHIRKEKKNDITNPDKVKGHELDWLANNFHGCMTWEVITGPQSADESVIELPTGREDPVELPTGREDPVELPTGGDTSWLPVDTGVLPGDNPHPRSAQETRPQYVGASEGRAADQPGYLTTARDRATRVMKTRARLAELSKGWELKDRTMVKVLKNAIEETMREVYDNMTLEPSSASSTIFEWSLMVETVFPDPPAGTENVPNKGLSQTPPIKIFFRRFLELLRCFSLPISTPVTTPSYPSCDISAINLTLSRKEDDSGWTPWRIDENELEAVLCLWTHYLSQTDKSLNPLKNFRILAPATDTTAKGDYGLWIHRETVLEGMIWDPETTRYFGCGGTRSYAEYLGVNVGEDTNILCAQEVYASFISQLVAIIADVGGDTTLRTNSKKIGLKNFCLVNSNLATLATIFNNSGLGTAENAYLCIISALRTSKKLPTLDRVHNRIRMLFINKSNIDERRLEGPPPEGLEYDISKDTVLQDAARAGLGKIVRWLMDAGADPNAPPALDSGRTALQAAAEGGHEDVVKILLYAGAAVNAEPAIVHGKTAIQAAAGGGHGQVVKILLGAGANVNPMKKDGSGVTALQAAAQAGHDEILNILLKAGAEVGATGYEGTALQAAARAGHESIVKILLGHGADIKALDHGGTALQAAAGGGHERIVKILLENGADVNALPKETLEITALQAAAEAGHEDIVKILLNVGANVNAAGYGRTALQAAAGNGYVGIVKVLLDYGSYVNAADHGQTALQAAAEGGHQDVVRILLQSRADINAPPAQDSGRTALQAAAGGGYRRIAKVLLESGADVNAPPAQNSGRTALQAAAEGGHEKTVNTLLKARADINAMPAKDSGLTALQAAVRGGYINIVSALLLAGASLEAEHGRAALRAAVKGGHGTTVKALLDHDPSTTEHAQIMLYAAAEAGKEDILEIIFQTGVDINAVPTEASGRTALQVAAECGHVGTVKALLNARADVNAPSAPGSGRTALQAAAEYGHVETVKALLNAWADVNAPPAPESGRTALQAAAEGGHAEIVKDLLGHGANPNSAPAEYSGRTALQAAARGGHARAVHILIEHGASINAPAPSGGRAAIQAAAEGGHTDIVDILLVAGADVNAAPALDLGRTALQAAAEGGHTDTVKALLSAQADVNALPIPNAGRTALQAAAGGGHNEIVEVLLKAGADSNAAPAENSGRTALQAAAEGGYEDIVNILLMANADTNAPPAPCSGRTALQAAAEGGYEGIVNILLIANADTNAPPAPYSGRTALQAAGSHLAIIETLLEFEADPSSWDSGHIQFSAAMQGYRRILAVLLDNGVDINTVEPSIGRTALQLAAEDGRIDIVKMLLTAGADVNISPVSNSGRTALQAAAEGGHETVVNILLEAGADANAPPALRLGLTALQAACDNPAIIETLLESGANPSSWDSAHIPLLTAVKGHYRILRILLDRGVDINAMVPDIGRTALQAAAEGGYVDAVKILLAAGADVNTPAALMSGQTALQTVAEEKNSGRTALQAAAGSGHRDIVEILLVDGADVNAHPSQVSGRTALQAAAEGGHAEIVKDLLSHGADPNSAPAEYSGRTALQAAAGGGHEIVINILLEAGAHVNAPPSAASGRTALQAAAEGGHKNAAKMLLEARANPNTAPSVSSGKTALIAAAEGGHKGIVRILLEAQARINTVADGLTALHAAARGHEELVKLLLEKGANPNAPLDQRSGPTVLQIAAEGGHEGIVRALLGAGANVNAPPAKDLGRTALQAAAEGCYVDTVRLLLEAGANINAPPAPIRGVTALQAATEGCEKDTPWRNDFLKIIRLLTPKPDVSIMPRDPIHELE